MRPISFVLAATIALAAAADATAWAESYPTRPVTVISAFPAGGAHDFIIRLVDASFQTTFRQPLILDHRAGAGGNIGADAVARSAPDGHTLLVTVDTVVTVNPRVYQNLKFKADVDLVPVIYLANSAQTLVCHPSVPFRSVTELVTYARSHDMSYASGGQGVPGHLAAEMFLAATGVHMAHIPYKGPSDALKDVMGGIVPCGFLSTPVVMPHVKSGKLIGLAVTSARRSPIAMELPTMIEAGVAGYEAAFGQLLLAPRGTPPAVVAALNEAFGAALAKPDVRSKMLAMDLEFIPNSPEQAAARVRSETQKWTPVVERLGLRAE